MRKIGKNPTLFLLALLASSGLLTAGATNAQTIPTPSVPIFTVSLVDHSYTAPPVPSTTPTYTIDPYSGKQVIDRQGNPGSPSYYVKNITIDLTITNQPYPKIINGNDSYVFYNVRVKGHYGGDDWTELYPYFYNSPVQSNSQYTVISLPANYRVDDKIDFQVQAAIGYNIITYIGHPPMDVYTESVDFQHSSSDWSQTQTFTMPDTSSITPAPTSTVPEFPFIAVLTLIAIIPLTVVFLVRKKFVKTKP